MSALSDAFADLYANEDLTWAAVYRTKAGAMTECRAFRKTVDKSSGLLQTGAFVSSTEIRILSSVVAQPAEGDKIALGVTLSDAQTQSPSFWTSSAAFVVRQAVPDSQRLSWILDVQEAGA